MAVRNQTQTPTVMADSEKLTLPAMRRLLWIAGGLVLIQGAILNLLPQQTESWFAWTPMPTMTTLFLGSGYWAAVAFEWAGARERRWSRASLAVPTVLAFTTLTLLATLLSLSSFHFGSEHPLTARGAAYAWLVVYVVVPPWMALVLLRQRQAPGTRPRLTLRLPGPLRTALVAQGAIMVAVGVLAFLFPQAVSDNYWPWSVRVLCMRAIAAWLIGIGIFAFDASRLQQPVAYGFSAYLLYALLQLSALARYGFERDADSGARFIDWGGPAIWIYLLFLLSIIAVAIGGWLTVRQVRQP